MKTLPQRNRPFRALIRGGVLAAIVLVLLLVKQNTGWAGPMPYSDLSAPEGLSSLGDTVWLDTNQDGVEDATEIGIPDVQVNLYLDGGDFIFNPGEPGSDDIPMGSQITDADGWYSFENIDALGNWYWVEIDDNNFIPGGPLEDYVLTSGVTIGPSPLLVQLDGAVVDYTDADFGYVPRGIALVVTKTANPESRPEPGGDFEFTVRLDNTSTVVSLDITSLVDDIHGDLNGQGTCVVPQTIPQGSFYQCSFSTTFNGNPGDTETDTVTAEGADDQGNPITSSDSATIEISDLPSSLTVIKTANPTSVPEPGGDVSFSVQVENTSAVDTITITSLDDDVYGDLDGQGSCLTPQTLTPGAIYHCAFTATVSGDAGDSLTDVVTASGEDDDGLPVSGDDSATVDITDVPSSIDVTKTANPTSVPETGGVVTFTVHIDNTSSADSVDITSLVDTIYGDLNGKGSCTAPQTIAAGDFYECSFTAVVSGDAGDSETDTVTATGVDDDGFTVSDSDDATVDITDVPSSIQVVKTASPTSVPETGGIVTFTVRIDNTSAADSVDMTSLVDSIYGDLNGRGSCTVPQTIVVGGFYVCSFTATVMGDAGDSETDTVTATGVDDDGMTVSDSDDATVDITDVPSSIQVVKTANPTSVPEPGGLVNFTVRIDNTSAADSVEITSLIDSIHGDLDGEGSCAVPQTIAPGGFYQCTFGANVTGVAGDSETDTVTATGVDDDGVTVSASDDATVDITQPDVTPTPTSTPTPTATPEQGLGCIEGHKIDDLHVGLPDWEIHARPVGQQTPHLGAYTDGTGYYRFDDLQPGTWNVWEIMQSGWEPVTSEMVTVTVNPGDECTYVRFKNRQVPPTPTPTFTPAPTATPGGLTCVEGHKIDDLHVGLPNWEIHALPAGGWAPHLVTYTDATGYFRFDDLSSGVWNFWEIMQDGWEPVTADSVLLDVQPQSECYYIRFKNRQTSATATPEPPTSTPTPRYTPTPTSTPRYTPTPTATPEGECGTGRLETTIWGRFHSYSLVSDGTVLSLFPLPWQHSTEFNIVGYTGPVQWTLYQPYWEHQVGGYQYVYPGGHAGDDFTLFVYTDCGYIQLQSAIDDPTPTPGPDGYNVWLPVINSPF